MSVRRPASLERLLEGVDWSRCSGRELHRLAEGAAQAAMRGEGGRPGGPGLPKENQCLRASNPSQIIETASMA